jgi:hypothetical protein|tara:strand:- start:909 stop:1172 length:264 start_codon:yes stop_codon:yes gene_type:complete
MQKSINILFLFLSILFFWSTYNYYSSNKNLNIKKYNLNNINQIISKKASNLPVLSNDTNDVIEFNNSISSEVINAKPRSFWNLLKLK